MARDTRNRGRILEQVVEATLSHGPSSVQNFKIKFHLHEAELACNLLEAEGLKINPYDFPGTNGVWRSEDPPYRYIALKEAITSVAKDHELDFRTVEGFKDLLPYLTAENLFFSPINAHGTTLVGLFSAFFRVYDKVDSYKSGILELVKADDDFIEIRKTGLKPYDFPQSTVRTWTSSNKKPTGYAREATFQLVKTLAEEEGVSYSSLSGFKRLLPRINARTFQEYPINVWGTTLAGMLYVAYENSPATAILDLIDTNPALSAIKREGIDYFDIPATPNHIWKDPDFRMKATKQLISRAADRKGVDYQTVDGFRGVLPFLLIENFEYMEINYWGTTLSGLVSNNPGASYKDLVFELVENDPSFSKIKNAGLHGYDFGFNLSWLDKNGNFGDDARYCMKQSISEMARILGIDYRTQEGFNELAPYLSITSIPEIPINIWGTTASAPFYKYNQNLSLVVQDLAKHDPEFSKLDISKIPFNKQNGS